MNLSMYVLEYKLNTSFLRFLNLVIIIKDNNMSFHVQKWLDNSNGWLDIPSKKEAKKKE